MLSPLLRPANTAFLESESGRETVLQACLKFILHVQSCLVILESQGIGKKISSLDTRLDRARRPTARLGPNSSHVPDIEGCELTGISEASSCGYSGPKSTPVLSPSPGALRRSRRIVRYLQTYSLWPCRFAQPVSIYSHQRCKPIT